MLQIILIFLGLPILLWGIFVEKRILIKTFALFGFISFLGLSYLSYQDSKAVESLDQIKRYEYTSKLTYNGSDQEFFTASDPSHPMIPSGLPEILLDSYAIASTSITGAPSAIEYKCDQASRQKYLEAIQFNPDYPFTYYALAYCEQKEGDKDWVTQAQKALAILKVTTEIAGHNQWQDAMHQAVQDMLKGAH